MFLISSSRFRIEVKKRFLFRSRSVRPQP